MRSRDISSFAPPSPYLTLVLVLEVVQTIAAFSLPGRLEVGEELLVAGVSPTQLLHCDELFVLDEEDAVAVARREQISLRITVFINESLTSCSS